MGVLLLYFVCGFQGIEMAKLLESQIRSDPNFEVPAERHLGLVVFCLKVCIYVVNYKNISVNSSFIFVK